MDYATLIVQVDSARHSRWNAMASYGFELSVIANDITLIGSELLGRYYDLTSSFEEPESAIGLVLKKFLLALADQDVCQRVYAYREKTYQFLNVGFIGGNERDPDQGQNVREWLGANEPAILNVIERFGKDRSGKKDAAGEAIERRHAFTHRLPMKELEVLQGPRRLFEWARVSFDDGTLPGRDPIDVAASTFELDDKHRPSLQQRIERIGDRLWEFEVALSTAMLEALKRRGLTKDS